MRIAFVLSTVGNYGPFIVARDIIDGIREDFDTIDIFYLKASDEHLKFKADDVRKIGFFDRIDAAKYDIIHSHGFLADAYIFYHRRLISAKTVTTMHQNIEPDYSMNYNKLIGKTLEVIWTYFVSRFDSVVCLSNDMVKYYYNKINSNQLTYVHNGISPINITEENLSNDLDEIIRLKENNIILGVSARLIYRKGIDLIINALAINENKKLILVVIGDGDQKVELINLAKACGVYDRCIFLGYKKDPMPYYKAMDIYIMSSRSEAFGLCVLEAASLRIAVICSDLSIYDELFDDKDVVKFESENFNSLSTAIKTAIMNKKALGDNIYINYLNNFTTEKMAQKYLSIYKALIHKEV